VTVSGTTHSLHLEKPSEIASLIAEFLSGIAPAAQGA